MPSIVLTLIVDTDEGDEEREVDIQCEWVVCPRCHGDGKHVHPDVDGHGISPDEFAEDPDFAEAYFEGVYDVTCYECGGMRVIAELPDEDAKHLTSEQRSAIKQHNEHQRELAHEARLRARGIEY